MNKKKQVWLRESTIKHAKSEAAKEGIKMYEYFDKKLLAGKKEDEKTRKKYDFF